MPRPTGRVIGGGVAAALASLLVIATPFLTSHEGLRTSPYFDSVGVKTVCIGETNVLMRVYTPEECGEMFRDSFANYALDVQSMSPGIENNVYEWLGHSSFAYNIGPGAYAKSSVRRLFNQGKYVEACRAMRKYKYAGGKVLLGLMYRREGKDQKIGEYEVCLVGAVQRELK